LNYPNVTGDRPPQPGQRPDRSRGFIALAAVLAWFFLVCGGFYIAKLYVDQSLQDIQQANAINVKELEGRLDAISGDVSAIQDALGQAGTTLSSSGTTQKELVSRIEKLDSQLQDLEKSLTILKEAPNAAR